MKYELQEEISNGHMEYLEKYNRYFERFAPDLSVSYDTEVNSFCISQKKNDHVNTLYLPFLALNTCEHITDDKLNNCSVKKYEFMFHDVSGREHMLMLNADEVNEKTVIDAVRRHIKGYGPVSSDAISVVYNFAIKIAQFGIKSQITYSEEGLSLDNRTFVYRGSLLDITQKDCQLSDGEKDKIRNTIKDFSSCSSEPGSLILLLQNELISEMLEAFMKAPKEDRLKLLPNFLTFIYGESGSGKTTISRAIYHAHDPERFIYVPNSTPASMQSAIKTVSSGTLLFDDIPHNGYNKCSSENKEKLESLIRATGDFGAEKRTSRPNEALPSPKRVMIAVTSEAPFYISASSSLRCIYCPIEKGSIDFKRFEPYRDSSKFLDEVNIAFIIWAFSELLEINDDIINMPMLDTAYQKAVSDTQRLFAGVIEPRAVDNFIHLELYWQIFAPFLTFIGFPDKEISDMKSAFDNYLIKSARVQQELIKLNSAEQAVLYTVEKTITSNRILSYKEENNKLTQIILDSSDNFGASALGYYNGHYLILTSEQQRAFAQSFSEVYSEKLKKRDIIDLLYKMALVVKPIDGSVLTSKPNNRIKIRINNKDTDVIVLKYTLKGDDSDD